MPNVSFDGVDLSSLGYSVHGINGRGLPGWKVERAEILGRNRTATLNAGYELETRTALSGQLSAPLPPNPAYSHAGFRQNLRALKDLLDPEKGYKKLVVTGDAPAEWRWACAVDGPLSEPRPVFKVPFNTLELTFDNLEPFWRIDTPLVVATTATTNVPNTGKLTRPTVTLTVNPAIDTSAAPANLFTIDELTVKWNGTGTAALAAGALQISSRRTSPSRSGLLDLDGEVLRVDE